MADRPSNNICLDDGTFPTRDQYKGWLATADKRAFGDTAQSHTSSPFVWIDANQFVGGCNELLELLPKLQHVSLRASLRFFSLTCICVDFTFAFK